MFQQQIEHSINNFYKLVNTQTIDNTIVLFLIY